jgi:hypothetical protein
LVKLLCCAVAAVVVGRQLYLGMTLLDSRASTKMRRAVSLPDVPGLLVNTVAAGSRPEELGFRKGDLVTAIERQSVASLIELRKILNKPEPKMKRVKVVRGVERGIQAYEFVHIVWQGCEPSSGQISEFYGQTALNITSHKPTWRY